jgi:hypothetical protein
MDSAALPSTQAIFESETTMSTIKLPSDPATQLEIVEDHTEDSETDLMCSIVSDLNLAVLRIEQLSDIIENREKKAVLKRAAAMAKSSRTQMMKLMEST